MWSPDSNHSTPIPPTIGNDVTEDVSYTFYPEDDLDEKLTADDNNGNFPAEFIHIAYGVIFFLAIAGNLLVIVTLAKNRSMRTVTNVLLLNLSVADFCFALFIMPYTVTQLSVENYVFGTVPCKFFSYIQAVMVTVSAFTLTAVSLERYFAICRPLTSRKWQTVSHAYKVILVIWILSALSMSPIAVVSRVVTVSDARMKCVEAWGQNQPGPSLRILFTLLLDLLLFLVPLAVMCMAYGHVIRTLYQQMHPESPSTTDLNLPASTTHLVSPTALLAHRLSNAAASSARPIVTTMPGTSPHRLSDDSAGSAPPVMLQRPHCRNSDAAMSAEETNALGALPRGHGSMRVFNSRSVRAKRRIVCMLIVIVIEFFACWTPTFAVQTWDALDRMGARQSISPRQFTLIVLISYVSTLCNPITYGFLNRRFRQAFVDLLRPLFCGAARAAAPQYHNTDRPTAAREEVMPARLVSGNLRKYATNAMSLPHLERRGSPAVVNGK